MTPIKTGAWLWRDEYNDGVWCDLYVIGDCLVARVIGEQEPIREREEGIWATMHTCPMQFTDARSGQSTMHTWMSNDFTLHYELQFSNGNWHSVELDPPAPELSQETKNLAKLVFMSERGHKQ